MAASLVLCAAVVRPLAGLTGYMSAGRAAATDACLDRIPANAPVAASGRLIPHLTHRLQVYRLGRSRGEQYLAVARDGQSKSQVLAAARAGEPLDPGRDRYRLVCARGDATVFVERPAAS